MKITINKKQTSVFATILLGIYILLASTTALLAVINFFQAQSKHDVKIKKDFPKLEVIEAKVQDKTATMELVPLEMPILDEDNETHKVIHKFEAKLDSKGTKINKKLFLKTNLSCVLDKTQTLVYFPEFSKSLFNTQIKIDGILNTDTQFARITPNKSHIVSIETELPKFLPNDCTHPLLRITIDYEVVDENGKPVEGTKGTIQKQTQTQSNN